MRLLRRKHVFYSVLQVGEENRAEAVRTVLYENERATSDRTILKKRKEIDFGDKNKIVREVLYSKMKKETSDRLASERRTYSICTIFLNETGCIANLFESYLKNGESPCVLLSVHSNRMSGFHEMC